jgi:outer membrane protein
MHQVFVHSVPTPRAPRWRVPVAIFFGLLMLISLATPAAEVATVLSRPHPASPARVSLQDCLQTALLNNRALQIERLNPDIARATLSSSYGYYDPIFLADARRESLSDSGGFDPADFSRDAIYTAESRVATAGLTGFLPSGMSYTISGDYANSFGKRNLMDFASYNLWAGFGVQQPLLKNFWIDQGRMTIQVNKKNLQMTELGVEYLAMDIVNQVQQAYYELIFARDNLAARERLVQVREAFLKGVRRQVQVGTMTAPDEAMAQAQLANAEATQVAAANAAALAENALRTLLGGSFTNLAEEPLAPSESLTALPYTFSFVRSWEQGLAHRPDLRQLKLSVARADIDLKFRRNQLFPSLDVVAGYGRRGASTDQVLPPTNAVASFTTAFDQITHGDNPNDFIGMIFSIPLTRTAERGNYRASLKTKAQSAVLVKQREEWIQREISDAIQNARSHYERLAATRRAREFFQTSLQGEDRKLAGGKSTVFFVLQLQGEVANAESVELRTRADYNKALSQLHFAEASILEKNRITIEIR